MPEGDTIYLAAQRLRAVLDGRQIVAAELHTPFPDRRPLDAQTLVGATVRRIEARGKHLLVHTSGHSPSSSLTVHSHLGMTGSWHVYSGDQPWAKPARLACAVLRTDHDAVTVCFSPKTLELLSAAALRAHPMLPRLGPDMLEPEFDEPEVMRRFRIHDQRPIGEAIMNQTIACGVGNVYKSEVLFLCRVDPFEPVAKLSDDQLRTVVRKARQLMLRNLGGHRRTTRMAADGARLWVYNRSGKPCLKCGQTIRMRRQGDLGRSTYWCPECQG